MSIKEKAIRNFVEKKYNCCQAVVCAYCEERGLPDETVFTLAEGFGGGMGGLQDVCGAATGMFMAIGMENSAGDKTNPLLTKMDTYKMVSEAGKRFESKCGSLYCRDIKRTVDGVQKVSCRECVETGASILEEYLNK